MHNSVALFGNEYCSCGKKEEREEVEKVYVHVLTSTCSDKKQGFIQQRTKVRQWWILKGRFFFFTLIMAGI